MKIVGHRGACGHAPENTLLSFQKAIELGCHRTELDVHLSKDRKVVVIHDPTVDRVTDGKGAVREMTLAQLKRLRCPQGQKIPTLQEVIDLCRGKIALQIELKGEDTARPVSELIGKNHIVNETLVISFKTRLLHETKIINSAIKTGYLFSTDPGESLWRAAEQTRLAYIGPKLAAVTKAMVDTAHQKGVKVYVWGVNDKESWQKMEERGIDDLGTDYPDLMKL